MFTVDPIASALGAELHGVNLATDMTPEVFQEVRRLLVEHEVVFFRDQDITPAQHRATGGVFWSAADASCL